jgi:hypothetical protein
MHIYISIYLLYEEMTLSATRLVPQMELTRMETDEMEARQKLMSASEPLGTRMIK